MTFEMSLVQLLVISAIANCLVYTVLVLFKKENRRANRFLALLLLSLCLTFTPYAIPAEVFSNNLWLTWMPLSLTYWIGPSLFFYIKSLTNPAYRFRQKSLWHFSLIVLNYLHSLYHLLAGDGFPLYALHYAAEFLEFSAIFSILIYSYLSMQELKQYNISILNQLSTIEHLHLKWIKSLIWTLVVMFTLIAVYLVLSNEVLEKTFPRGIFEVYRQIFLTGYAIMLYWLSIGGFKQTQIINKPFTITPADETDADDEFLSSITNLMTTEQLYRDPQLSLKALSVKSGLPEKQITSLLNIKLKKNFYTFVNEFRVREVKEKLSDPSNDHLKILSLAFDAGFNSKATFNRIFKEFEGVTPQECKQARKIS